MTKRRTKKQSSKKSHEGELGEDELDKVSGGVAPHMPIKAGKSGGSPPAPYPGSGGGGGGIPGTSGNEAGTIKPGISTGTSGSPKR